MANVLHIDGVAYPIGARVVDTYGNGGVIVGYETRVDDCGGDSDTVPLSVEFLFGHLFCGPNALNPWCRVTLVNPPAPTPAADPMEDEHEYDEGTV